MSITQNSYIMGCRGGCPVVFLFDALTVDQSKLLPNKEKPKESGLISDFAEE